MDTGPVIQAIDTNYITNELGVWFGVVCGVLAIAVVIVANKIRISKAGTILAIVIIAAMIGFGWKSLQAIAENVAERIAG